MPVSILDKRKNTFHCVSHASNASLYSLFMFGFGHGSDTSPPSIIGFDFDASPSSAIGFDLASSPSSAIGFDLDSSPSSSYGSSSELWSVVVMVPLVGMCS